MMKYTSALLAGFQGRLLAAETQGYARVELWSSMVECSVDLLMRTAYVQSAIGELHPIQACRSHKPKLEYGLLNPILEYQKHADFFLRIDRPSPAVVVIRKVLRNGQERGFGTSERAQVCWTDDGRSYVPLN
jgi:hypothetical protein